MIDFIVMGLQITWKPASYKKQWIITSTIDI